MGVGDAGAHFADVVVRVEVVLGQEQGDVTDRPPQMEVQNAPARHRNRPNAIQKNAVQFVYFFIYWDFLKFHSLAQ